ncbi:uncharacterized protein LOC118491582 [Helianthus annuus]|uniref:uncharacterized protein LOC118491582 n=1 Tax=Helianthus annuus TaxID=4232 RepID=UPI0016531702|nr:uncharacterized protein LOC118491582 [Helianthus annuus]
MDFMGSSGQSGGLACVWDPSIFSVDGVVKNHNFLAVKGCLKGCGSRLNIFNVYAPQGTSAKKSLWDQLEVEVVGLDGLLVLVGDFNAVRFPKDRKNSSFKPLCARKFNSFIFNLGLLEYKMSNRQFTRWSGDSRKMSKIDKFLVSADFFSRWPEACLRALSNKLSDHCPLLLDTKDLSFGPKPFWVFNSCLGRDGFEDVVVEAASAFVGSGNPDVVFSNKLRFIKNRIKAWRDKMRVKENEEIALARDELEDLELIMEIRDLSEDEEWALSEIKKVINDFDENKARDTKQRSRVKWIKEGDENSKFFHAMVNNRKASNAIHGLSIDGSWCDNPSRIKKFIFEFFREKFKEKVELRPNIVCDNLKKLKDADVEALTQRFGSEEIKIVVFEYGDDRSPGPDGFNFR